MAYAWSPDGRWLAVQYLSPGRWSNEVGLVPASGDGQVVDVSNSGYEDGLPRFSRKGEILYWQTDRQGLRNAANNPSESDVFAAFLTRKAWDRFRLDEAAYDQLVAKEKEKKDDKPAGGKPAADVKPAAPRLPEPVAIEFDGLEDRTARLSMASADLADAQLSPDGEVLYYLARVDKGYDLYKYTMRKKEAKQVAGLGASEASFLLDKDGKKAYVLADHRLSAIDLDSGKPTPVGVSARMDLNPDAERAYMFEHAWRQTYKKFFDPKMHGIDWPAMKAAYAKFLPQIDNNRDFAELVSEMQGELDASHTGCRYRPVRTDGDQTAALGIFPDAAYTGAGIRIAEVIEGGPLQRAGSKVRAGVVIESIDGARIAAGDNWYVLLNRKADTPVRLGLLDPANGTRWEETVKPIAWGAQQQLLYRRWWHARRDAVTKLSGGRLGYAHIRGMSDGPYRELFDEIFGRDVDKAAIVLDTRFNGGGNLVEALTTFLTGRTYATHVPRGQFIGTEPSNRWTRPSIVVMNEGNYSDAHCFPMAYTELGIGETVGMPVPGTCTSVWWERLQTGDLVFGIPMVGMLDTAGDIMENKHLAPTYEVEPDPALVATGRDQQLEKAVDVLMAKLPKR